MFEPLVADDSNTKYSASVVYIKTLKQIEQAQRQFAEDFPNLIHATSAIPMILLMTHVLGGSRNCRHSSSRICCVKIVESD